MFKLRELERSDLREINLWRNKPDLIDFLGAPFRYINYEVDENWFNSYMNNRGNTVRCSIIECDENGAKCPEKLIGIISLTDINYINQTAIMHIMIGKNENQGRGAGFFSINTMLKHAFYNLNLNRITLTVLTTNIRAIHLYEKCGFILEGKHLQAIYKNGKFVDTFSYAILKQNWKLPESNHPENSYVCVFGERNSHL